MMLDSSMKQQRSFKDSSADETKYEELPVGTQRTEVGENDGDIDKIDFKINKADKSPQLERYAYKNRKDVDSPSKVNYN